MISYDDFKKIDLRVAKISTAERVENSEKLVKLQVDLGNESRQVVSGVGKAYSPEELVGREIVIVANLEPRTFTLQSDSGQVVLESQGMLLAASAEDGVPVLLGLDKEIEPGSIIR